MNNEARVGQGNTVSISLVNKCSINRGFLPNHFSQFT